MEIIQKLNMDKMGIGRSHQQVIKRLIDQTSPSVEQAVHLLVLFKRYMTDQRDIDRADWSIGILRGNGN